MDAKSILGVEAKSGRGGPAPTASEIMKGENRNKKGRGVQKQKKTKKVPREVLSLMEERREGGEEGEPALMPSRTDGLGVLNIAGGVKKGVKKRAVKWGYLPFSNSGRSDQLQLSHWVPIDNQLPDYFFARFNKPVDMIMYTDEEYKEVVTPLDRQLKADIESGTLLSSWKTQMKARGLGSYPDPSPPLIWSKKDTDSLFHLLLHYNMRFAVVHDRWDKESGSALPVRMEDIKERYYTVAAAVLNLRDTKGKDENAGDDRPVLPSSTSSSSSPPSGLPSAAVVFNPSVLKGYKPGANETPQPVSQSISTSIVEPSVEHEKVEEVGSTSKAREDPISKAESQSSQGGEGKEGSPGESPMEVEEASTTNVKEESKDKAESAQEGKGVCTGEPAPKVEDKMAPSDTNSSTAGGEKKLEEKSRESSAPSVPPTNAGEEKMEVVPTPSDKLGVDEAKQSGVPLSKEKGGEGEASAAAPPSSTPISTPSSSAVSAGQGGGSVSTVAPTQGSTTPARKKKSSSKSSNPLVDRAAAVAGSSEQALKMYQYDLLHERLRTRQLDYFWRRDEKEAVEERELVLTARRLEQNSKVRKKEKMKIMKILQSKEEIEAERQRMVVASASAPSELPVQVKPPAASGTPASPRPSAAGGTLSPPPATTAADEIDKAAIGGRTGSEVSDRPATAAFLRSFLFHAGRLCGLSNSDDVIVCRALTRLGFEVNESGSTLGLLPTSKVLKEYETLIRLILDVVAVEKKIRDKRFEMSALSVKAREVNERYEKDQKERQAEMGKVRAEAAREEEDGGCRGGDEGGVSGHDNEEAKKSGDVGTGRESEGKLARRSGESDGVGGAGTAAGGEIEGGGVMEDGGTKEEKKETAKSENTSDSVGQPEVGREKGEEKPSGVSGGSEEEKERNAAASSEKLQEEEEEEEEEEEDGDRSGAEEEVPVIGRGRKRGRQPSDESGQGSKEEDKVGDTASGDGVGRDKTGNEPAKTRTTKRRRR